MEKRVKFPIMEHFYTVQGEGAHTGKAAYFIRLGGCDVGCVWCDVKDSWDAEKHPQYTITEIVDFVKKNSKSNIVVITGGEPAMYDLTELTSALKNEHYQIHIETSGAYELIGHFDWVTFSPKKFKVPVKSIYNQADELKVVVYNKSDFHWGKEHAVKVSNKCQLYLQPEWSKHEKMQTLIFDFVKEYPNWKISLQTHKFLGVD